MTLTDILAAIRRKAGDIDPAAQRYTDTEITQLVADARRVFGVRRVSGMDTLTVTTTAGSEGIDPEPTDSQGELLAVHAALHLLRQVYRERVATGSIGVSWRSGLEEESTISQQKAYQAELTALEHELEELLLITQVNRSGSRPQ